MKLHYLQHVPFEDLGSIEQWAIAAGAEISCTKLYNNEALPLVDSLDWLVIMGGPMNIYDYGKYPWLSTEKLFIKEAIEQGKIVLGICLGAQLIADVLGSKVYANQDKEIGWLPITISENISPELKKVLPINPIALHWHGDTFDLPEKSVHLAKSKACQNQGFIYQKKVIGLQFHLETTHKSLSSLIENCRDGLIDAPFIQSAEEMLCDNDRFTQINIIMDKLLSFLKETMYD